MFRKLFKAYQRWRHTRGYGVHSPFAYTVVKDVIRPGRAYRYYAYDDIDNALEGDHKRRVRRETRILLRLAAFTDARSVFIPVKTSKVYRTALAGARSDMKLHTTTSHIAGSDIICSDRDYVSLDSLVRLVSIDRRIIALRKAPYGWREKLFEAMTDGVMFYGKENVMIIPRPEMQKIAYSIHI